MKSGAEENEALIMIQYLFSDRFFYCMNEYRYRERDALGVTHNITEDILLRPSRRLLKGRA